MARSKRHHYVPKALLRWFRDGSGTVWYSERDENGVFSEPEARTINGIFWERDFNTIVENEKPSDRLEVEFWGEVDNLLGKYLHDIHRIVDDGKIPRPSDTTNDNLRALFSVLMRRTHYLGKDFDPATVGREVVEKAIEIGRSQGISDQITEQILLDPVNILRDGRHLRAMATARVHEETLLELQNFVPRWAVSKSRASFIIGDKMIQRTGNGGPSSLDSPTAELLLPISPKRMLVLTRNKSVPNTLLHAERDWVRSWNEKICETSQGVASHSRKLLSSLVNGKPRSLP